MEHANRLLQEKSPYLLQHAGNPVDWFPWGDEAFERARREDKPVFLSIGYSTCHWCHVMERESFGDEEVARVLNAAFVCVKVDREERPDLDRHYMSVCQALTGSGGWPLTVVMTPDKRPFFAGTYFPKSRRWGRVGLLELVPLLAEAWKTRREDVIRSADGIVAALAGGRPDRRAAARPELSAATLDEAFRELAADFDRARGGFGSAPKFPMPHAIGFLLRTWKRTGAEEALAMAVNTLRAMRSGGIFDHLGFGFHRYSTDAEWLVPHFEKMLYDQALLAEVYAEAFAATGKPDFKRTVVEVIEYVLRDLTSPEGGFFTAEDADSEGEEGKFYLWSRDELGEVLGPAEAGLATRVFGVSAEGNFAEPGRSKDGRNILHTRLTSKATPAGPAVERIREKLFLAREKRPRPFKDTKILADWNGLMIAALAAAFRVTGEDRYLRAAGKAAEFILGKMRAPDGRLLHVFADGKARIPAFLDDHAFMIRGLVGLYGAGFDPAHLEKAVEIAHRAIRLFWDDREGGFFYAGFDPASPVRGKEIYDGAVPSGNSVMLTNLLQLARLTGRQDFEEKASRLTEAFSVDVGGRPRLYPEFLRGLDLALGQARELVVVGKREAPDTQELLAALRESYLPNTVTLFKPTDEPESAPRLERLAPFTKHMGEVDGRAAAYVCSGGRCLRPVTTAGGLLESL
jgi:uncharacterized protein YyaL (SSP411 family)